MTPTEATKLARLARAACPQQHFDEYTPDIWFDLLSDLDFEDAKEALLRRVRAKPFVAPAEIRAEVRVIRDERRARQVLPAPGHELTDDPDAYKEALARIVERAGDGRVPFRAIEGPARTGGDPTPEYRELRTAEDRDRMLAKSIPCPVAWCPALAGEPCSNRESGIKLTRWHPARLEAARAAEGAR